MLYSIQILASIHWYSPLGSYFHGLFTPIKQLSVKYHVNLIVTILMIRSWRTYFVGRESLTYLDWKIRLTGISYADHVVDY